MWTSLVRDARSGFRMLVKHRGFTAIAVLTLALGIAADTAIFSVVYATFLAPLPYRDPARLVMVFKRLQGDRLLTDAGDFTEWKRQATSFSDLNAWTIQSVNVAAADRAPEHVEAGVATPALLAMTGLGHPLTLGRDFLEEDGTVGRDQVAILSHALWQSRFAADRDVVGRQVRIDGKPRTIVGVLGAGPADRMEARLWLPMAFTPEDLHPDVPDLRLYVVGRLKPGVTVGRADAEIVAIARRLGEAHPTRRDGWSASVEPFRNAMLGGTARTALWLLLGAVTFVLLIACANVANLLLARGTVRQRELAVRAALGASPAAIVRQLLAEGLALALLGGGLGVALAAGLLRIVMALMPDYILPAEADVRLSLPVLLFTLVACVACSLLFGGAPAWQAARVQPGDALKESARSVGSGHDRLRRALVVGEMALALTLLAGGGLALHSLVKLARVDLGFRKEGLLTFALPVPGDRLATTERIDAFYRELLDRTAAIPGVRSASVSTTMPLSGMGFAFMRFDLDDARDPDPSHRPMARLNMVTPDYFAAFGIRIEQGRAFTGDDRAGALPVAIVNAAFARQFLPRAPLRHRIAIAQLLPGQKLGPEIERQVVGVCADARSAEPRSEAAPEILLPFFQSPWPDTKVAVRTATDPMSVGPGVAAAIRALDPDLPMADLKTMEQVVSESVAGDRFNTALFGAFGGVALLLATAGIYGVMSFVVAQRTREIGIRMALGAARARVLRDVLRDGMTTAALGTVLGSAGAYAVGRLMRGMVYGVGVMDPAAFVLVAVLLLGAALLACLVPARRAASVDPIVALRDE